MTNRILNPFYWYVSIWSLFLFLYMLDFSYFNDTLDERLLLFIVFTIIASLGAGLLLEKIEKQTKSKEEVHSYSSIWRQYHEDVSFVGERNLMVCLVVLTIAAFIVNFHLQGSIPLLGGTYRQAVDNIAYDPTEHVPFYSALLIGSFALSFFLSYLFVKRNDSLYLLLDFCVVFLFILNGSRGYSMDEMLVLLLLFANKKIRKATPRQKNVILLVAIVVIVFGAALFGALGNIRSGFKWNDNSFILGLGRFHDNFPGWMHQFAWAYLYATTPLANLSLNCVNPPLPTSGTVTILPELVPETFAKHLTAGPQTGYVATYFTASTGYIGPLAREGLNGCVWFFIYIVVYTLLMILIIDSLGYYKSLMRAVLVLFTFIQTFLDPYVDVMMAYVPWIILFLAMFRWCIDERRYRDHMATLPFME